MVRVTTVHMIWCMTEEPIEFRVTSMRDKVRHSTIHHNEVEVVMAIEEVTKVEEDTKDIEDEENDVDEDR